MPSFEVSPVGVALATPSTCSERQHRSAEVGRGDRPIVALRTSTVLGARVPAGNASLKDLEARRRCPPSFLKKVVVE